MVPPATPSFDEICDRLRLLRADQVLHEIWHTIRHVYHTNAKRYDESAGDDASTFGFLVYRNSWCQLEQRLPPLDPMLSASRPSNSLSISTGGPRLKFYKGGKDETFELEAWDLDYGSRAKYKLQLHNEHQLTLFEALDPCPSPRSLSVELDEWVVVHAGNPREGLTSIWVGAPRRPMSAGDSPWAFVHQLPDLCNRFGCSDDHRDGSRHGHSTPPTLELV